MFKKDTNKTRIRIVLHAAFSWLRMFVVFARSILVFYFLWNSMWSGLFWPLMWRDCLWNLAIAIAICPAWDEAK